MSAPAIRPKNHLKLQNSNSLMGEKLSIFDIDSDWLKDEVYVHGLRKEIREILVRLGGPSKACKLLGVSYVALKEWPRGRKPISLEKLNQLISFCDANFQEEIKFRIDLEDVFLSCRYSPYKIKFPKQVSSDLAYCVGLILGDGTLAGDSLNEKGNWIVSVFFDNKEHRLLYDSLIHQEFGFTPNHYLQGENCFVSGFSSKAVHWFLRSYKFFKSRKINS